MSEVKVVDIRGLLDTYEFPCTLPGSGQKLTIKPITTGQMKKILAYENESDVGVIEDALDRLISECVLTPEFDISKLYLQDRFYLLLEIRKVSKGNTYSFGFKCPKCRAQNTTAFSLSELEYTEKKEETGLVIINERLKLEVSFPTREDQRDAIRRVGQLKGLSPKEREVEIAISTFANCIRNVHTPDGIIADVPFEQKHYILDNVPTEIFDRFKKWFGDNEFGVKFERNIGCHNCSYTDTVKIPLTDFFV